MDSGTDSSYATEIVPSSLSAPLSDSSFSQSMQTYFPSLTVSGFGPVSNFVASLVQAANTHAAMRYVAGVEKERLARASEAVSAYSRQATSIAKTNAESSIRKAELSACVDLERVHADESVSLERIREEGALRREEIRLEHEFRMAEIDHAFDLRQETMRISSERFDAMLNYVDRQDARLERLDKDVHRMMDALLKRFEQGDSNAFTCYTRLMKDWNDVVGNATCVATLLSQITG